MYKKLLLGVVTAFAVVSLGSAVAAATPNENANENAQNGGQPTELHCENHENEIKVETTGDPQTADQKETIDGIEIRIVVDDRTVSFFDSEGNPIVVVFCVKGGSVLQQSGEKTGSTYTHPQGISYVVVYGFPEEEPEEPEEPVTPVVPEGGTTPVAPQPTQVDAPAAAVNAGGGVVTGALLALVGSVGALGYGLYRFRSSNI